VLPLVNLSANAKATDVIGNNLIIELLKAGDFVIVDPGSVDEALRKKRQRHTDRLPLSVLRELKSDLGVDYALVGTINEYNHTTSGTSNLPTISLSLRIVTCSNGRIVWAASHSRRGDDKETVFGLGRIDTLEQLATIVAKEITRSLVEHK
jgi:TolB-like protein